MNSNADFIPTEEAVIVEPGGGATPTISSLRSAVLQSQGSVDHDSEKRESGPIAANVPAQATSDVLPSCTASSPDAQAVGRHPDVTQTSDFSSDTNRRQPDVKQTSIQKRRPSGRQSDVARTSTPTALSKDSYQVTSPRRATKICTEPEEDGRLRHTVRLEPRNDDQLRFIMNELVVDMNTAFTLCIMAQYRQLKRSGNRGT